MISCPAAKQIRCVKPSMATVSPSRTSSAMASRIVVTFEPDTRPRSELDRRCAWRDWILRPPEHAQLVPLRILHHDPGGLRPAKALQDGGAEFLQPLDLGAARSGRPQVEVEAILHRFRLGNALQQL